MPHPHCLHFQPYDPKSHTHLFHTGESALRQRERGLLAIDKQFQIAHNAIRIGALFFFRNQSVIVLVDDRHQHRKDGDTWSEINLHVHAMLGNFEQRGLEILVRTMRSSSSRKADRQDNAGRKSLHRAADLFP